MVRSPSFDPIDYLVGRRFPHVKGIRSSPMLEGLAGTGDANAVARLRSLAERDAYKQQLRAKTDLELQALVDAERAKELAERTALAAAQEQARFFNQPQAKADLPYWSKMSHWTLDEAVALSFNRAPEIVNWASVKPHITVSPFAFQYGRRYELCLRAVPWKQLFDPVLPGIFLGWAKRNKIDYPEELKKQVLDHGHAIIDWKSNYDELKALYDKLLGLYEAIKNKSEANRAAVIEAEGERNALRRQVEQLQQSNSATPPKGLSTKERQTLLKLIIGMAVGGYGYDPKSMRSGNFAEIASDLNKLGLSLDEDTIRKWLRSAADVLPTEVTGRRVGE